MSEHSSQFMGIEHHLGTAWHKLLTETSLISKFLSGGDFAIDPPRKVASLRTRNLRAHQSYKKSQAHQGVGTPQMLRIGSANIVHARCFMGSEYTNHALHGCCYLYSF